MPGRRNISSSSGATPVRRPRRGTRFSGVGLVLLGLLLLAGVRPAQSQTRADRYITAEELAARLRFLSSDLLEGRAPGTRGEALTLEYLVSELTSFGVRPGVSGGWLQPVSILVHDPRPEVPVRAHLTGAVERELKVGREVRVANNGASGEVDVAGELVFVGFGIDAPLYGWDDFGLLDLTGKIAVGRLGEPSLPGDTVRFNGVRASRYSWTRDKVLELNRRGAIGVLWIVADGSMSSAPAGGARQLAEQAAAMRLKFSGNITDSAVARIVGGPRFQTLMADAGRPGFRAQALGTRLGVRFATSPRRVESFNVVGTVPGTVAARRDEHLVLSAHWDAFGIGRSVAGDSIYNGALDDGSGTTMTLALARAFAANPEPRSISFVFTTAEEWGLLGAEAFVCSGPIPMERVVANLNLDDGMELFGPKRDVAPLGIELSSLGETVARLAARSALRVAPDPYPEEGFFLRADNYPFARAGVPALYMALGTDAVGRPKGWTDEKVKEYLDRHYHRPSDDYGTVVIDIKGAEQLARFTRDVAIAVARAPARPTWHRAAEFGREPPKASPGCR